LAEEVRVKERSGIEYFQTDDSPVLPIQYDHRLNAVWRVDRSAVASRLQRFIIQMEVRGISPRVVCKAHAGDSIGQL
jgi:hypothetical protein